MENEKYYEHLQRTAAEFDNYKKRVMKEKEKISCVSELKDWVENAEPQFSLN